MTDVASFHCATIFFPSLFFPSLTPLGFLGTFTHPILVHSHLHYSCISVPSFFVHTPTVFTPPIPQPLSTLTYTKFTPSHSPNWHYHPVQVHSQPHSCSPPSPFCMFSPLIPLTLMTFLLLLTFPPNHCSTLISVTTISHQHIYITTLSHAHTLQRRSPFLNAARPLIYCNHLLLDKPVPLPILPYAQPPFTLISHPHTFAPPHPSALYPSFLPHYLPPNPHRHAYPACDRFLALTLWTSSFLLSSHIAAGIQHSHS